MSITILKGNKADLRVSVGTGENRKQFRKRVTYSGKKDLDRQYREFENECSKAPSSDTVADILDLYLSTVNVKTTTKAGYLSLAKLLKADIGSIKARDLTPMAIQKMTASHDWAPKTIKNVCSLLSSAYKLAIRYKLLSYNPCQDLSIPKQIKTEKVILGENDIMPFCAAMNDIPLDMKVCFELALFCGFRTSEILGLKESDVSDGTITTHETRHRINGVDVIQGNKTEKSRRTLVLPDFLREDIENLIASHDSDCEYLIQFCGSPMNAEMPRHYIKRFTKKHNLPDVTMHGLRHTFASMLNASRAFDIAEISAALGHSNIATTMNIYTHLFVSQSAKRVADYTESYVKKIKGNF